jgi:hypothetical protein
MSITVTQQRSIPEVGDRAVYHSGLPQARRQRVVVTDVFANGRIKVEFLDGSWKSLARRYHSRIPHERYGLVPIR